MGLCTHSARAELIANKLDHKAQEDQIIKQGSSVRGDKGRTVSAREWRGGSNKLMEVFGLSVEFCEECAAGEEVFLVEEVAEAPNE